MLIEWFFAKKKKIDKGISIVLTVFFFFFCFLEDLDNSRLFILGSTCGVIPKKCKQQL